MLTLTRPDEYRKRLMKLSVSSLRGWETQMSDNSRKSQDNGLHNCKTSQNTNIVAIYLVKTQLLHRWHLGLVLSWTHSLHELPHISFSIVFFKNTSWKVELCPWNCKGYSHLKKTDNCWLDASQSSITKSPQSMKRQQHLSDASVNSWELLGVF